MNNSMYMVSYTSTIGMAGIVSYTSTIGMAGIVSYTSTIGMASIVSYTSTIGMAGIVSYTPTIGMAGHLLAVIPTTLTLNNTCLPTNTLVMCQLEDGIH